MQAITAQVNPENAGDLPDETRTAFEEAGGKLLALGDKDWRHFLANAYKPVKGSDEAEQATQAVNVVRS